MQGSENMEENGAASNGLNTSDAPPANGGTPNSQDSATDLSTSNHVILLFLFLFFHFC